MKKSFLFLLFISFSFIHCYSQTMKIHEGQQIKRELTDSINALKNQIITLENKLTKSDLALKTQINIQSKSIDTISKSIDDTRLRESLKLSESTINKQNSLIGGFGTLYAYITVLIGILAFMLPVMVYLFGILPARKQIRKSKRIIQKMNNNLDSKFDEYIIINKERQINSAIVNIKGQDKFLRSTALNFLQYGINHGDLNDNHLQEIYKLLTLKNFLDENSKLILSNILCCKKNQYSELYFKDVVVNERPPLKHIGLHYFLFSGFEQYLEDIANMILDSDDPVSEYVKLILYLSSQAPKEIVSIINYRSLNEKLSLKDKEIIKSELDDSKYELMRTEIKASFLFNDKK